jgi:hypothetical protein
MATKQKTQATEAKETPKVIRPEDLAKELNISGKQIRAFLRREFTRPLSEKRTSWLLTKEMADAVRDYFLNVEEDEDDVEDLEVDE